MSRDVLKSQLDNASLPITDPLLLILWAHSGLEERLSCSDPVTLGGQNYADSGVEITGLRVGESATVIVAANTARVQEVKNGTYRNQICKIYSIAADPSQEDDFELFEATLALDGIIVSSEFTGTEIRARIENKHFSENLTPRNNISQVANHIPPAGTVIVSDKQNVELERSR